jgi:hypothetical protein
MSLPRSVADVLKDHVTLEVGVWQEFLAYSTRWP